MNDSNNDIQQLFFEGKLIFCQDNQKPFLPLEIDKIHRR